MRKLMARLPVSPSVAHVCSSEFWASLHWVWIGQFGVFQRSDESLFRLLRAMSGFCRCLFYKAGACGGYRLFVSSRWTGEFCRVFALNSCDIRTSLFGLRDWKAQPAAQCAVLPKLSSLCVHTHTQTLAQCQKRQCAFSTILQKNVSH